MLSVPEPVRQNTWVADEDAPRFFENLNKLAYVGPKRCMLGQPGSKRLSREFGLHECDNEVVSVFPPWIHVFASVLEVFGFHGDFPLRSTWY